MGALPPSGTKPPAGASAASGSGSGSAAAAAASAVARAYPELRPPSSVGFGSPSDGDEHRESSGRELRPSSSRSGGGSGHTRTRSSDWALVAWTTSAADALRNRLRLSQERRPDVPRYVVVGVTAIAVLSVLTGFGANNICNFAGFVYPLYMSWKAVRTVDAQDDTQWLTYWVVYGFLNVCETWTRMFGLTSLPFYSALKVSFLVWCFHPRTRGADLIFQRVITPLLLRYEQRIDTFARWWIGETQAAASDVMSATSADLQRRVSRFGGNIMRALSDSIADEQQQQQPQAQSAGSGSAAGGGAARGVDAQALVNAAARVILNGAAGPPASGSGTPAAVSPPSPASLLDMALP